MGKSSKEPGAASILEFSGLDVFAKPYNVAGLLVATFVMMNIGAAWFRPGNKTYWDGLVAFRGKSRATIEKSYNMPMLIATSGILALLQATAILLLLTALAPASYTDTLIIILFIWVGFRAHAHEEDMWQGMPPGLMGVFASKSLTCMIVQSLIIFTFMKM